MKRIATCLAWACLVLSAGLPAEDVFLTVPLPQVAFTGQPPQTDFPAGSMGEAWRRARWAHPRLVMDGEAEGYLSFGNEDYSWHEPQAAFTRGTLAVRAARKGPVSGTLYWPRFPEGRLQACPFTLAAPAPSPDARRHFFLAKKAWYGGLGASPLPGAAWFRYQAAEAGRETGQPADGAAAPPWRTAARTAELQESFSLFTGGRALAENLQLDRSLLLRGGAGQETVKIADIAGITVREMDWSALVAGRQPELDPLARLVPADQHALFFPRFDALASVMDAADRGGTPVLELLDARSEDYGTKARYQRMLCLPLTELGRKVGPMLIRSVAVTGSDPYLRLGSDVAVLFETDQPELLKALLLAQRTLLTAGRPVAADDGSLEGVVFTGVRTPDRAVCSYLAVLGNAVAVTNSPAQLRRLVEVRQGKSPALAGAPEYVFFRDRYPRSAAEEDAFLLLTDAAIRRWCSPRCRIADSRRIRAAALLADFRAANLAALAGGKAADKVLLPAGQSDFGEIALRHGTIVSSAYGTLEFLTPAAELPLETATREEADAYARWRDTYQSYWRTYFDPIAVRFTARPGKLGLDATVMPLILGSDYASWLRFADKGCLPPDGAGLHDALFHLAVGIDPASEPVRRVMNLFRGATAGSVLADSLNWLGNNVSVFLDDDPFWGELQAAPDANRFLRDNWRRFPAAFRAEVASPMKLAIFLTALRAYVDQTAPGLTAWEARTYAEIPYVCVTLSERSRQESREDRPVQAFYLASGDTFLVTLNEALLQRCLDRRAAAQANKERGEAPAPPARPWLGESYGLQVDARAADLIDAIFDGEYRTALRRASWASLPVLNEWRRLFPGEDPVLVHERLWHVKLVCPGGGRYVWNEADRTMESSAFGHPGAPKDGPPLETLLQGVRFGNFGLTFEEKGLRARATLEE